MKNKIMKRYIYICLLVSLFFVVSCYQPTPLTGTWSDNKGSQLTMFPDYNFAAKIRRSDGVLESVDGTYNVLMNAIAFTTKSGYQVVSEWDIRGNMLYIYWTDSRGEKLNLTLYKTKN